MQNSSQIVSRKFYKFNQVSNGAILIYQFISSVGSSIERLCDVAASDPTGYAQLDDRGPMVRAARALLGSVTRVLLLADIVVVKQLLLAKDRVSRVPLHSRPYQINVLPSFTDIKNIR